MKITFLGTGTSQGIPVIACDCEVCSSEDFKDKRLRTAAMVSINDFNIAIDAGPDFRQQMLVNNVKDIEGVLITHEHNDHIIGLDDVRPFNFRYKKDMPIYSTESVAQSLKKRFSYAFDSNPYPGAPRFQLRKIEKNEPFELVGYKIIPIEVMHGRLPVLGFRFGDLTYITDAKTISPESIEKIKGTKVLVLNALRKEVHHSHLSLEEALQVVNVIKPARTYFTHLSHNMGTHQSVSKLLPENVEIAYDGLVVEI